MIVGPVHRRDVDSTFTCLASNSNMTQASRATVHLQMNRKNVFVLLFFFYLFSLLDSTELINWPL